jgi:Kef-type K+ transport system membrane component KefB
MGVLAYIRSHALALPPLAKFALGMVMIFGIPPLSRRVRLPTVVGLVLSGVVAGPHVLDIFGEQRPIAEFLADLGRLLSMFVTGLGIDLAHARQAQRRSILFGLSTSSLPFLLGTAVSLSFGYGLIPTIVVGTLLASHTLLGSRIVAELGANRLEPVTVTIGATLLSDTLSLVVFALCVSTYERGFSMVEVAVQLMEIAMVVALILCGLSRVGAYALQRAEGDEDASFVLMFGIMAGAGVLAHAVNLPDIVGAFLAGLAVNAAAHDKPATEKLAFFGNVFFIPIFFAVTGFLIDPTAFVQSIHDNFALVAAMIVALVAGKWLAAELAGRAFTYTSATRLTMWSLTLPQVATTLAATLVAFNTYNAAGQRLIDRRMLDVVLALMCTTAMLGPVLTQQFAPRMLEDSRAEGTLNRRGE